MESRAREMGARLVWKPDLNMPRLTFDPEAVHRAVLNIVTNAIDAVHDREEVEGGAVEEGIVEVTSEFRPQDGLVRIVVADNGPGIPEDKLEKIFTFFVSDKRSRGTGLGLPVAKKIIDEHGGRIDVESEVGLGTRFILLLPARIPDGSSRHDTQGGVEEE
jgi:signal transduction histidine kinase